MKIAVHQPNYLPWLGYFHKLSQVDIFVFLDTVQFERRGYTNRVQVAGTGGDALWLTQNIRRQPMHDHLVKDVAFSDRHWIRKHLRTLDAAYRKTPHFNEVFSLIERAFHVETDCLSDFNGKLTQEICTALHLPARLVYASQIDIGPFFSPSERIARITSRLGGKIYLSGAGAKAYNDSATFARYGIELQYNDFAEAPYPQRTSEFKGGLSIVDALFNLGFDAVARRFPHVPKKIEIVDTCGAPG